MTVLIANKNRIHQIDRINRKLKHNTSEPIHLNGLDKFTSTNTHKLVHPYRHQLTSSYG